MIRTLVPIALTLLLVGCTCSKVEEPQTTRTNLAPSVAPNLAPTPPSAKPVVEFGPEANVDLNSLPVKEDYEVEAEKAITPKNLLEKVDELDKEVSKDISAGPH